jgi:hypothetical protein
MEFARKYQRRFIKKRIGARVRIHKELIGD